MCADSSVAHQNKPWLRCDVDAPHTSSAREGVNPILHRDAGMVGIAVSVGQEEGGQVGFQHMYVFLPQPSTVVQQTRW